MADIGILGIFSSDYNVNSSFWIPCDGSAISRTTYSSLFDFMTKTASGTLTSGSAVVTMTDTSFLETGQYVEGTGVPSGATITVDSATQITLSANATASGAQTLRFSPEALGDGSTTFNIDDLSGRHIKWQEDTATGNAVKISNLTEDTALSDEAKSVWVEGATTVFAKKSTVFKGYLKRQNVALTDAASINIDFNSCDQSVFTLTTNRSAITFTFTDDSMPKDSSDNELAGTLATFYITMDTGNPTIAITLSETNYTHEVMDATTADQIDLSANTNSVYEISAAYTGSFISWKTTLIKET